MALDPSQLRRVALRWLNGPHAVTAEAQSLHLRRLEGYRCSHPLGRRGVRLCQIGLLCREIFFGPFGRRS